MIPELARCVRHHRSCSWHHTDQVRSYREERQRQEQEREDATGGYPAELEEWDRTHTMITFKQWITMGSRHDRQQSEKDDVGVAAHPHHLLAR